MLVKVNSVSQLKRFCNTSCQADIGPSLNSNDYYYLNCLKILRIKQYGLNRGTLS